MHRETGFEYKKLVEQKHAELVKKTGARLERP
jgi:hypothetical protein